MEELAAEYGYAAAFFQQDPELTKLIKDAVAGQWSVQKFQAKFMATNWYRTHEASVRQWADLSLRDPAEAAQKIADRKLELGNLASQYGFNFANDADLAFVAEQSLKYAWSDATTKQMMTFYSGYQPGHAKGTPATLEMQVKSLANDYGLSATDSQLSDWVTGLLAGRYTQDNVTSYLRDMAKSKYAGMSKFLDQGLTVKQVAQPYLQSYSQLLEVGADAIDLNDNLIQQALQGTPDASGNVQMQSVYQFERALRRDSRWARTKNAHDEAINAGQNILRDMGLVS